MFKLPIIMPLFCQRRSGCMLCFALRLDPFVRDCGCYWGTSFTPLRYFGWVVNALVYVWLSVRVVFGANGTVLASY